MMLRLVRDGAVLEVEIGDRDETVRLMNNSTELAPAEISILFENGSVLTPIFSSGNYVGFSETVEATLELASSLRPEGSSLLDLCANQLELQLSKLPHLPERLLNRRVALSIEITAYSDSVTTTTLTVSWSGHYNITLNGKTKRLSSSKEVEERIYKLMKGWIKITYSFIDYRSSPLATFTEHRRSAFQRDGRFEFIPPIKRPITASLIEAVKRFILR